MITLTRRTLLITALLVVQLVFLVLYCGGIALSPASEEGQQYLHATAPLGTYDPGEQRVMSLHETPLGEPTQIPATEVPLPVRIECDLIFFFLLLPCMLPVYGELLLSKLRGALCHPAGIPGVVALVGLCRFNRHTVLADPTRKTVYEYAVRCPGSTSPQIARHLGYNGGTVIYHLERLTMSNCLRVVKAGKTIHYFAKNRTWDDLELRLHIHLRNDISRLLLKAMLEQPYITSNELCGLVGRSKSTISWYMDRFEKDGIISIRRAGRNCYNSITPSATPGLAQLLTTPEYTGVPFSACATGPDRLTA